MEPGVRQDDVQQFHAVFSFYLLSPLLPIYLAERFGSDKDTIGLVLSGYVIAALLVRPFSGFIVDTFDRRKVLMVCFFLFFICFAGYLGAVTLPLFAVVRTFHGLPFGSATVANSTAAIDALPSSRRNEGIGYYGLSNNLAMAVAPSAGIWLYSLTDDFRLLFWISLIVAGIGFYCTTTVRLPARPPVEGKPRLSLDRFFLTRAWLMAANILLFGLCWGVMGNYVSIYGKEVFGITNGAGCFSPCSPSVWLSRGSTGRNPCVKDALRRMPCRARASARSAIRCSFSRRASGPIMALPC